eukprot:860042-Pleurochrysis_carterae.AAC.3
MANYGDKVFSAERNSAALALIFDMKQCSLDRRSSLKRLLPSVRFLSGHLLRLLPWLQVWRCNLADCAGSHFLNTAWARMTRLHLAPAVFYICKAHGRQGRIGSASTSHNVVVRARGKSYPCNGVVGA